METTKTHLKELKAKKDAADKAYFEYRKQYNTEHGITGRSTIKEIINLYKELTKKGVENPIAEIIAKGYNKNTVRRQVGLFVKKKKVETTVVKQYLTKK